MPLDGPHAGAERGEVALDHSRQHLHENDMTQRANVIHRNRAHFPKQSCLLGTVDPPTVRYYQEQRPIRECVPGEQGCNTGAGRRGRRSVRCVQTLSSAQVAAIHQETTVDEPVTADARCPASSKCGTQIDGIHRWPAVHLRPQSRDCYGKPELGLGAETKMQPGTLRDLNASL